MATARLSSSRSVSRHIRAGRPASVLYSFTRPVPVVQFCSGHLLRRTQGIVGSSSLIVHGTALSGTDLLELLIQLLYVLFTLTFLRLCGCMGGRLEGSMRNTRRGKPMHLW